jgi:predicted regulator of Ras-like GTPase activity (Roadblock/LC7/MglB family)
MGQRGNLDWVLEGLPKEIPEITDVVVFCADGLRIATWGTDQAVADRLAAASSGLRALVTAIGAELPRGDGRMKHVAVELADGLFHLMEATAGAYLAVLSRQGVDPGLLGARMRDLVARLAEHLVSPPRPQGQTA